MPELERHWNASACDDLNSFARSDFQSFSFKSDQKLHEIVTRLRLATVKHMHRFANNNTERSQLFILPMVGQISIKI